MRGWQEQEGALGFSSASISVSGFTHFKPNDTRSCDEPFPCSGCMSLHYFLLFFHTVRVFQSFANLIVRKPTIPPLTSHSRCWQSTKHPPALISTLPSYLRTGHDFSPDLTSDVLSQVLEEHPHPPALGVCSPELVGATHSSLSRISTWRGGEVMTCSAHTDSGGFRGREEHL